MTGRLAELNECLKAAGLEQRPPITVAEREKLRELSVDECPGCADVRHCAVHGLYGEAPR